MDQELFKRIKRKEASITVIGLGHVGLITAAAFAGAGFQVIGVDIKPDVVESVSSGKSHIREHGLERLIKKVVINGKLTVTNDARRAFMKSDIGIVCVQTPLTRDKQPDRSHLQRACTDIGKSLSKGKLVVVESSVPPGTTKNLVANLLEAESNLKCGKDFWLAHCPERIFVGNAARDLAQNDRIVGGDDRESIEIAKELFRTVTKGHVYTTDSTTAEVAKLAENSFRDVNIAFANELALVCERTGVDVMDVVKLANTHPRVRIHKPGCGVGGPCLPKDPHLLLDAIGITNLESKVMLSSRHLNEYMPTHTVNLIVDALGKGGKDIKTSKITILGAAYKGESDDVRGSPSKKIIKELRKMSAKVIVYDPYVTESFGATRASDIWSALKGADCAVIATDHELFKKLELKRLKKLMNQEPTIVDGRRLVDSLEAKKLGFRYVGVGFSS
jgi:UDP-N-acetyl-D-mannosaminuronic acid dehydrogenase